MNNINNNDPKTANETSIAGNWGVLSKSSLGRAVLVLDIKNSTDFSVSYKIGCYVRKTGLIGSFVNPKINRLFENKTIVPLTVQGETVYVKVDKLVKRLGLSRESILQKTSEELLEAITHPAKASIEMETVSLLAVRIEKVVGFKMDQAREMALQARNSPTGEIERHHSGLIVGKLEDGEWVIGQKTRQIGQGGTSSVYGFQNLASPQKTGKFVLKELRNTAKSGPGLGKDHEVLTAVHGGSPSPHIASPLAGRMTQLNRVVFALQKREGLDLFYLIKDPNRPSLSLVLEGIEAADERLQDAGFVDLDSKLENYVISSDGGTVLKVDLGAAFKTTEKVLLKNLVHTPFMMPREGLDWLDLLIRAKNNLVDSPSEELDPVVQRVLKAIDSKEENLSPQKILDQEYEKTIARILTFQKGLMAYQYIAKGENAYPYSKGDFSYQKLSERKDGMVKSLSFFPPQNWDQESGEMQRKVMDWLDPSPFIQMRNQSLQVV